MEEKEEIKTFYYYEISKLEDLRASNLNITRIEYDSINLFKIAVKRGERYYDVVSLVPLTTDPNAPEGIQIENIREATDEEIERVANKVLNCHPSAKKDYKRVMQEIHEREKANREYTRECKRILSKLALRMDK